MRGYFVHDVNEDMGIAVVANSAREAKKIGFNPVSSSFGSEWIDVSVKWVKEADVSGIEEPGELPIIDGLRCKIFAYAEGLDCEICGEEDTICELLHGKVVCERCIEKQNQEGIL